VNVRKKPPHYSLNICVKLLALVQVRKKL